jgi:hypothetical protein
MNGALSMRSMLLACALAGAVCATAIAQQPPPASASVRSLDSVVVRGVVPGPGLWKVTKGDHVLWILGTLTPLPKDITWDSSRVVALIAKSQEVVTAPEAKLKSNANIFANLAAVPALIGVRNNPNGRKLDDVVPPALYARWAVLKAKYIGRGDKVESWRPIFAALELYDAAIRKAHLTDKPMVQTAVESAAWHAGVKVTKPQVVVSVEHPRAAVKEFKSSALDDTECFRKTLDRIDGDLAAMTARANAWSRGDLAALRRLPYTDQMTICHAVLSEGGLSQTHGLAGINARAHQVWIDAVVAALEKNQLTVATLPIGRLLQPDPYLSRLRALGYVVEAPAALSDEGHQSGIEDPQRN